VVWNVVSVGEPRGVGDDLVPIVVAVPGVVGVRAILDVEHGVSEAVLPEGRVRRLRPGELVGEPLDVPAVPVWSPSEMCTCCGAFFPSGNANTSASSGMSSDASSFRRYVLVTHCRRRAAASPTARSAVSSRTVQMRALIFINLPTCRNLTVTVSRVR
jgi:hypothetical protein